MEINIYLSTCIYQRRLYCPTCLSGSETVVSLDICFGRKQPSATSFMSRIILVWCTRICHSSVSPGIHVVPYPLERDDGCQIRWAWYPEYQAFQSHSWSNSVYMVFPRLSTHLLFTWGLLISSSHHVPRSCFTTQPVGWMHCLDSNNDTSIFTVIPTNHEAYMYYITHSVQDNWKYGCRLVFAFSTCTC